MKRENQTNIFLIYVILAVILGGCASGNFGPGRNHFDYMRDRTKEGDNLFKQRKYELALEEYEDGLRYVKNSVDFEARATDKDTLLSQRYQNLSELYEIRIKIAKIAIEVQNMPPQQ